MCPEAKTRRYRKQKRAEQELRTRRRITEAAVQLHGTLGPARTGITDIAKRAGVSRMTVYNHFPTDTDLFMACSTHWAAENPFPDPTAWSVIEDPTDRLLVALRELYAWYRRTESMMDKVLRDAATVPALGTVMSDLWVPYVRQVVSTLADGWGAGSGRAQRELTAALRLAVDFGTWRRLADSRMSDRRSAALVSRMVAAVVE